MGTQIRFWQGTYKNSAKSKEAGIPIFDSVPWCEIRVLGEPDTVTGPWHLMSPSNREAFKDAFAKWERDNSSEGIVGTPLEKVAWLEAGEVETLRYAGIRTLENLANVADGSITRIPGGLSYRQRARDMLTAAKEAAPLQQMSDELAKRDAEITSLRQQMQEILEAKRRKGKDA